MARVLEQSWEEHIVRCRSCGRRIGFTIDDVVLSTYIRGLDYEAEPGEEPGWIDGDCLWHYIECPNCGKYICVTSCLNGEENEHLEHAYNNS